MNVIYCTRCFTVLRYGIQWMSCKWMTYNIWSICVIVRTDLFIKPLFEINLSEVLKNNGTYFINSAHQYKTLLNLQLYIVFCTPTRSLNSACGLTPPAGLARPAALPLLPFLKRYNSDKPCTFSIFLSSTSLPFGIPVFTVEPLYVSTTSYFVLG